MAMHADYVVWQCMLTMYDYDVWLLCMVMMYYG